MTSNSRAWFDENNVLCFGSDVTVEEAQELEKMLSQAFNAGLRSGWKQGTERARDSFSCEIDESAGLREETA